MKQVQSISVAELESMERRSGRDYVKAVVDPRRKVMVVDMRFHNDAQPMLEEEGSDFLDIWGIRLHPEAYGTDDFVEFDSMLNIKPERDNQTTSVEDPATRQAIIDVVDGIVKA